MNRVFAIWMLKRGCVVVLWTVFFGWMAADSVSDLFLVEFITPVAFAAGIAFLVFYPGYFKRYLPVLNVLPVSQLTVARGFWWIFVVAVPSSIFVLEGIALVFLSEDAGQGLSPAFFERWIAALGMTASWSIFLGLGSRLMLGKAPVRTYVAVLAMLLIACGLSTTWVPRVAESPVEGNIVLAVSIFLVGYSYRHATDAWSPRRFVIQHQRNRQFTEMSPRLGPASTKPCPAGFLDVHSRPALVGAALGGAVLALLSALVAFYGASHEDELEGDPAFVILLICVLLVSTCPYWLPNMRSLRMLPLSRAWLTSSVLALALSALLGAPLLVLAGRYVFGWDPVETAAMVCAAAGAYLCGVVGVIRFGTWLISLPLMAGTIILAVECQDQTPTALIVFGVVCGTLAYAWLYALLGHGTKVYHRANALNQYSPDEV